MLAASPVLHVPSIPAPYQGNRESQGGEIEHDPGSSLFALSNIVSGPYGDLPGPLLTSILVQFSLSCFIIMYMASWEKLVTTS